MPNGKMSDISPPSLSAICPLKFTLALGWVPDENALKNLSVFFKYLGFFTGI